LGPIDPALRAQLMASSGMAAKYATAIDRDSAYERLRAKADRAARDAAEAEDDRGLSHGRRYDARPAGGAAAAIRLARPLSKALPANWAANRVRPSCAGFWGRSLGGGDGFSAIVSGGAGKAPPIWAA
jgi:hypothetical protein